MARADDLLIVGDARGVRRVRLGDYLRRRTGGARRARRERVGEVAARRPRSTACRFRERFTHRGDSLWWFAELYLHKMQVANRVFRTLLALEALVERERPVQLGAAGSNPYVRVLARRVAERDGLAWIGGGGGLAPSWLEHLRIAARAHLYMAAVGVGARDEAAEPPRRGRAAVAAFVHAAFWRGHEEQYVGAVLRELEAALPAGDVALVGLGPETSYKARAWHHRVSGRRRREPAPRIMVDAFAHARRSSSRRAACGGGAARCSRPSPAAGTCAEAAVIRGCDAWPLVEPVLMGIAYLQFPWSAQVMDQLGAALDALQAGGRRDLRRGRRLGTRDGARGAAPRDRRRPASSTGSSTGTG